MARDIPRKCPKHRDYFGVAVSYPTVQSKELQSTAWCAVCGDQLKGRRVIVGGKREQQGSNTPFSGASCDMTHCH